MDSSVRVRFAPSPTGYLHVGNVRVALFNYLFARKMGGSFILRIEDTDEQRNQQDMLTNILHDLRWLGLTHDEGPYYQSARSDIYAKKLRDLADSGAAYRCFCTPEALEAKRETQRVLGQAPRYDRACFRLSSDRVQALLEQATPFIWRLYLGSTHEITIQTLERGAMRFDLSHFSDFALTRQDGSATFMFANFVDDWTMKITHVIRGEDHLTNTAMQAALYHAFSVEMPIFLHLPLFVNDEGKKLSKRDFGFSLDDLRHAGYIPEAIINYLATTGASFMQEVLSLSELIEVYDFKHMSTTGTITYDGHKLTWLNQQWLSRLDDAALCGYIRPWLDVSFPESSSLSNKECIELIRAIKGELKLLSDVVPLLRFYFERPHIIAQDLVDRLGLPLLQKVVHCIEETLQMNPISDVDTFLAALKNKIDEHNLKQSQVWQTMRYVLTGTFQGMAVHEILSLLPYEETVERMRALDMLL